VALLHINPSLMGVVSTQDDVAELAAVLRERRVAVIEDFAYHSIGSRLGGLGTFLREPCDCCCLLGLSKALSVPNGRIGLLLTEASRARALVGGVENSVGHVSTVVQAGLLEALRAGEALDAFLDPGRYDRNRGVMIACLEGVGSPALADAERDRCEELIREEVRRFVAWKRARGSELDVPAIVAGLDPGELDGCDGRPADLAVAALLRHGLRRWFRIVRYPDAGFFVVVSCLPLLRRGPLAGLPLRSAFDVFATLEFLLGVRTLPGDLLGMPADGEPYLRLSFSCGVETIVRAAFLMFVGLSQLSTLPVP
jgi:aspartate/methionine/tyrosine aminotransferase